MCNDLLRRIAIHRTSRGDDDAPFTVTQAEFSELVSGLDPIAPLNDPQWDLKVMGVNVHVERGPYPWGSFPDG